MFRRRRPWREGLRLVMGWHLTNTKRLAYRSILRGPLDSGVEVGIRWKRSRVLGKIEEKFIIIMMANRQLAARQASFQNSNIWECSEIRLSKTKILNPWNPQKIARRNQLWSRSWLCSPPSSRVPDQKKLKNRRRRKGHWTQKMSIGSSFNLTMSIKSKSPKSKNQPKIPDFNTHFKLWRTEKSWGKICSISCRCNGIRRDNHPSPQIKSSNYSLTCRPNLLAGNSLHSPYSRSTKWSILAASPSKFTGQWILNTGLSINS